MNFYFFCFFKLVAEFLYFLFVIILQGFSAARGGLYLSPAFTMMASVTAFVGISVFSFRKVGEILLEILGLIKLLLNKFEEWQNITLDRVNTVSEDVNLIVKTLNKIVEILPAGSVKDIVAAASALENRSKKKEENVDTGNWMLGVSENEERFMVFYRQEIINN